MKQIKYLFHALTLIASLGFQNNEGLVSFVKNEVQRDVGNASRYHFHFYTENGQQYMNVSAVNDKGQDVTVTYAYDSESKTWKPTKRTTISADGKTKTEEVWDPNANDGKGGWVPAKYPSSPDDDGDMLQQRLRANIMSTMLKFSVFGKKPSIFDLYKSWGPAVVNRDDIRGITIIFNPYYEQEDPFKKLFWEVGMNSVGGKGYVRNPFTMGHDMEYGYGQTTAEKLFYSQFNPGNIDPYFQHTF